MSVPTGPIKTKIPNVSSTVQWEAITKYDSLIERETKPVGWPVDRVRATIAIESQGIPTALQVNPSNGNSYGLLQIVPYGIGWKGWHELVKEKAGLPANATERQVRDALYDPAINIAVGVAILESFYQQHGTLDKASSAFFTGRSDWGAGDTVNGTTGKQYQTALNGLIAEQKAFAVATEQGILNLISNNTPGVYISFGFGQPNIGANGPVNIYHYGKGHGTAGNHIHPGIDIWLPDETPVNAIFGGEVICVGTQGRAMWGQGCGYFSDDDGGIGKISVLTDRTVRVNGKDRKMMIVYGHMSRSLVRPGERIADGQRIGFSGVAAAWPHIHLDVGVNAPELNNPSIWNNPGEYHLLDPIPTLISALGGGTVSPPKAERLPIPQPEEFDRTVTVTVVAESLPVLQRADVNGAIVSDPLKKGDQFQAVYQVVGNDGRIYWVSTRRGRVPVEGTSAPDWKGGTASTDGISQESLDVLVDTLDTIVVKHERDTQATSKSLRGVITELGNLKGVA